ncbi:dentin sialophosphoprotein-like [Hemicordylus capensis]|uniref:dentin sialophosphoprotein-like n=1 Tax=Hemicordylus capensis TaxID=884348 RepID=UPI002302AAC4|nr:dentin sialophosphoprotein-like [Hemicordylus capensis]
MEKYISSMVIFCAALMPMVLGFPYSDVSIACDSMLPDHGSAPQTSTPPYVISVSFDKYDPGNEIQVNLEGTSPSGFKAFMVQAREVNGNVPLGSFRIIDPNSQGFACANISNSAVSHRSSNVKHRITTYWIAPQGTKKIRLMATFVQDYDVYWVGVHSKTLSPRGSDAMNDSKIFNDSSTTNSSEMNDSKIVNNSSTTNSSEMNDSKIVNDSMTTNSSEIARDSITSVVSEITAESDVSNDNHRYTDFNTLLADSELDYRSETPEDSEATHDSNRENATARSKRKSVVTVNVKCGEGASQSNSGACIKTAQGSSQSQSTGSQSKVIVVKEGSSSGCTGGASQSNSGACIKIAQGSSQPQSSGSQSKVIVVKQGSSSGCAGGGVAGVYNQYGCGDSGSDIGSQSSYGQSVSTNTGSKVKVVTYPDSKPYPPVRDPLSSKISNSKFGGIIHSQSSSSSKIQIQGSRPQSGSSQDVRITIQSGQGNPACDKSSSSYNIQTCNQGQSSSSQSSGSQSSGSYSGSQSSSSQSSSSSGTQGQSSSSQSSGSSGTQQGGSYSSGSSPCGQGTTYDSNPCHQGQSSSSQQNTYNNQGQSSSSQQNTYNNQASSGYKGNSNSCYQGKDASSYNSNKC